MCYMSDYRLLYMLFNLIGDLQSVLHVLTQRCMMELSCFTIDKIILMQKPYGLLDIHFIIHYCVSLVTCSIIDNILVCVTIL